MATNDGQTLEWKVRMHEYIYNLESVRGFKYVNRMLLWSRLCLRLIEASNAKQKETGELMARLAIALQLEPKDVGAYMGLLERAGRDLT